MNQTSPVNYAKQNDVVGTVRTAQVEEHLSLIEQEIEDNSNIIDGLSLRLSSVILAQLPTEDASKQTLEECLVPMADRLRTAFKRLRTQNIALRQIINGIEL